MQIYETFEKDPVKYERYEAAILKALQAVERARAAEIPQEGYMSIPMADGAEPVPPGVQPVVVTVVGAGRGPLVAAALGASCTASRCAVDAFDQNLTLAHLPQMSPFEYMRLKRIRMQLLRLEIV